MKKFFLFIFIVSMIFTACSRKDQPLVLNPQDEKDTAPGVEWILILSPYVPCHENAGYESAVTKHLRRGAIRRSDGNCFVNTDGNSEKWYSVEEGWLPENTLEVFSNKLKAEKALSELK